MPTYAGATPVGKSWDVLMRSAQLPPAPRLFDPVSPFVPQVQVDEHKGSLDTPVLRSPSGGLHAVAATRSANAPSPARDEFDFLSVDTIICPPTSLELLSK